MFEGNGYSEEWIAQAAERGLSNISVTYDALYAYKTDKTIAVFEKIGILSSRELHARYEIELENYVKKIQIESRVIGDLALNHIVSTVVKYQFKLAQTARSLTDLEMLEEAEPIKEIIRDISSHVVIIKRLVREMTEGRKTANNIEDLYERAKYYGSQVKVFFDEIRYHVDKLELLIDDEDWPLAKYREMLFLE